MDVFSIIGLLGGLAMFLYGMRLMSSTLKESSSGALKVIMEKATNNVFKAFLLGLLVTALIQSSTATIVITSGLVAAGIISLRQSIGIIVGANVGTTVTGQIIRLLDLNESKVAWLQVFKPSTLAPVALIIGVVLIMFIHFRKSEQIGGIAIGFGILFSGLLNMTNAVHSLTESPAFLQLFADLDDSPVIGYLSGAGVAFVLQSSSAAVGILQTFSTTGQLTFKGIYAVLVGIYLGDCVTTAIVCWIGAKTDAKRVGIINILFNLGKSALALIAVTLLHSFGVLESIWDKPIYSGGIANTNTIFNLGCALLLFPVVFQLEKFSRILVRDRSQKDEKYADKLAGLNPQFYSAPAIAFNSCYDALLTMYQAARQNIRRAWALLSDFDEKEISELSDEEDRIDVFADRICNYLIGLSSTIKSDEHLGIMNEYYRITTEFERLGDHAVNISEAAEGLHENKVTFSESARRELEIIRGLISRILDLARIAFEKRDEEAARSIEPLEEVVDDLINALRENHLKRLSSGECTVVVDSIFLNLLSDIERISDICSNIGVSTMARIHPELAEREHSYISSLHQGRDENFNRVYREAHSQYFGELDNQPEK
ncbi:MAG: Na/Pi cotransporter family protein [Lachnospiraceae bacterium]|nr:Na/Pi cotransporter family protein [Lachnospiraceae bacterium]